MSTRLIRRIRVLERDLTRPGKEIERQEDMLLPTIQSDGGSGGRSLQAAEEELSQQQAEMVQRSLQYILCYINLSAKYPQQQLEVVVRSAWYSWNILGIDAFELGWNHDDEIRFPRIRQTLPVFLTPQRRI